MVDVSIIIPTCNRKELLREAVLSCAKQEGVTIEIIIVDDGGSDNTEQMLRELPFSVHYLWQENKGPGAARNAGMRIAQGRYIKFLDSDDLLAENALVSEVIVLDSTGADVSYGKWDTCNFSGKTSQILHGQHEGDLYQFILEGSWYANFAFLFRRDSLVKHQIFWDEDIIYVADFSFIFSVTSVLKHCVHTPICTGYYRKSPQHKSLSKIGDERLRSYTKILHNQYEKDKDRIPDDQKVLFQSRVSLFSTIYSSAR